MTFCAEAGPFADLLDLASSAHGGVVLRATDDFFAGRDNLLSPATPVFDPDRFTERGKWMDGWESRRKRESGHDHAVIRLGVAGVIRGVDIDTRHFLGNHPPFAAVDAIALPAGDPDDDDPRWEPLVPQSALRPGRANLFAVADDRRWTHLRLHIYPDGGVARLRVWGRPCPAAVAEPGPRDYAAAIAGGRALACSDMFFGRMEHLIAPGRAENMGGGWETRRRRGPGHDWIIVQLGARCAVSSVELDTAFFIGNYPASAAVDGVDAPDGAPWALTTSEAWAPLVAEAPLGPDANHAFEVSGAAPVTHVRLRVFPDGGVSRMRVIGTRAEPLADHLNALAPDDLTAALTRCCGARRWVEAMAAARPFRDRAHVLREADAAWSRCSPDDQLEAFGHHPRLGADPALLRARFAATATWSAGEQAGAAGADEATLAALQAGNEAYEARFGHVFLLCASGLTAAAMLAALRDRLDNDPDTELAIAAAEHRRITRLRLDKLVAT